jgi:hypothetical protein
MVRGEQREPCRERVARARRGVRPGIRLCRPLQSRRFYLDEGMRPVYNACSGEPGEVPDDEVNAHLGNPESVIPCINIGRRV